MSLDKLPPAPQVPTKMPDERKAALLRAAAFGGGFAIIAFLLLGTAAWWLNRPKEWSDRSITAKSTELMAQRQGEDLRLEFQYAFTNNTKEEYELPSHSMGALMRKLPEGNSLAKIGATWDSTIKIPPQQSIGATFSIIYHLSEYGISSKDLQSDDKLSDFLNRRLKEIDGLVFFDYTNKYKIMMSSSWNIKKQ